jgi:RimJ/RimL family protein N-acetyltransferase
MDLLSSAWPAARKGPSADGARAVAGPRWLSAVVEKLRTHSLRDLAAALRPQRIDMFIYEGDKETLAAVPRVEGAPDVPVERFDAKHPSGIPEIDEKAVGSREVYVVRIDGRLAHIVVLAWDILLPSQFGFDPDAPVMDLGFTWPEFRGRRLQPMVRRYVTEDVIRRRLYHKVYGTIMTDNVASQRGNARAGMRRLAHLQAYRIGGLMIFKKVLPWEEGG